MIYIHQSIIKHSNKRIERHEIEESWKPPLDLFSITIDQKSIIFNQFHFWNINHEEKVQTLTIVGTRFPWPSARAPFLEVEEETHLNVEEKPSKTRGNSHGDLVLLGEIEYLIGLEIGHRGGWLPKDGLSLVLAVFKWIDWFCGARMEGHCFLVEMAPGKVFGLFGWGCW